MSTVDCTIQVAATAFGDAPNNGQTQQQKQQACLDKINNSPDGKFYNFFSAASPWLAPDTLAWDTSHAVAGGAYVFFSCASPKLHPQAR
jgi:hypothetical protein